MEKPLTQTEQQASACLRKALQFFLGENLFSLRLFGSRVGGEGTEESDLDVFGSGTKKGPSALPPDC
jgi:predicted nucleotidyltransferase